MSVGLIVIHRVVRLGEAILVQSPRIVYGIVATKL